MDGDEQAQGDDKGHDGEQHGSASYANFIAGCACWKTFSNIKIFELLN
jgi:hypothetical protein